MTQPSIYVGSRPRINLSSHWSGALPGDAPRADNARQDASDASPEAPRSSERVKTASEAEIDELLERALALSAALRADRQPSLDELLAIAKLLSVDRPPPQPSADELIAIAQRLRS